MATSADFVIENKSPCILRSNVEPEGQNFPLAPGEQVSVYGQDVAIRFSLGDDGVSILSLWPSFGEFRVEKDGVNLFDTL